ncbi:MAG TPA: hypothetical protein VFI57_07605 [Pyrinomonadaceae bacterium]|nr:hypothetical protein [Pyrinomonadaceae bacterium]
MRRVLLSVAFIACAACSGNNDNAHTTATTVVPPPPRQVLRAETRPSPQTPVKFEKVEGTFDRTKPLLIFNRPNGKSVREGEEVVIDFSLANVKLRGEGGEYRVRYMVDDDDMQWLEHWKQVVLTGWLPGTHTIRVELIGPDGWPYRNGDRNVETREILVTK